MTALEFHPLANLFPLIEGKDFDEFCAGLKTDGRLHDRIVLFEDKILDGRNRQRACDATGVTAHYRTFNPDTEGDPLRFVVAKNLHRRHLTTSQRAMLAADLGKLGWGGDRSKTSIEGLPTEQRADVAHVGHASVERADIVKEHGTAELQDAVRQDRVAVSTAAEIASLPAEEQNRTLALSDEEIIERARGIRAQRSADKRARAVEARAASLVTGGRVDDLQALGAAGFKAGVILADPPWKFRTWTDTNDEKSARAHYDVMDLDAICKLPVADLAAHDCALFIWATWPTIFQTEKVIEAWGFRYSGLAWEWFKEYPGSGKPTFGTGYGTRKNLEPCLLAIKGKPTLISRSERDWLVAPRAEHSVKPDEQYRPIEAMYAGPYLELFARRERPGWLVWGNQVPPPTIDGEKFNPDTGEIEERPAEVAAVYAASDAHAVDESASLEPQAKADDEAMTGPLTQAPGADVERPVQTVEAELASRPAGGRSPDTTSENGRDGSERRAPDSVELANALGSMPTHTPDDHVLPDFLKLDRSNRAPFMREAGE